MYKYLIIILLLLFIGIARVNGAISFALRSHKAANACYIYEPFLKSQKDKGRMKPIPVGHTVYFNELCGKCTCTKTYRTDVLLLECRSCPRRLETIGCEEKAIDFRHVRYPKCCIIEDACTDKDVVLV